MDLLTEFELELTPVCDSQLVEWFNKVENCDVMFEWPMKAGRWIRFRESFLHSIVLTHGPAVLRLMHIVPGKLCELHGFVLGAPISRYRRQFIGALAWAIGTFDLKRVEVRIPWEARALRRFLLKTGFVIEGVLAGTDEHMLGATREEVQLWLASIRQTS